MAHKVPQVTCGSLWIPVVPRGVYFFILFLRLLQISVVFLRFLLFPLDSGGSSGYLWLLECTTVPLVPQFSWRVPKDIPVVTCGDVGSLWFCRFPHFCGSLGCLGFHRFLRVP